MNGSVNNNYKFLKDTQKGTVISIRLTPNSSKQEVIGYTDEYLKLKICAPPVENKANKQLIIFLAKTFSVPKSKLTFIAGEKSKIKRILIEGIKPEYFYKNLSFYDRIES